MAIAIILAFTGSLIYAFGYTEFICKYCLHALPLELFTIEAAHAHTHTPHTQTHTQTHYTQVHTLHTQTHTQTHYTQVHTLHTQPHTQTHYTQVHTLHTQPHTYLVFQKSPGQLLHTGCEEGGAFQDMVDKQLQSAICPSSHSKLMQQSR